MDGVTVCGHAVNVHGTFATRGFISFRYNKQLTAQLVGRHEICPTQKIHVSLGLRSGDMNFLGGTNLHVSLQTGQ